MPHMIVIMANPFIQIINIYFLVFFIFRDPAKAERELGWKAERDLKDMCRDSWNWQKNNPEGYAE